MSGPPLPKARQRPPSRAKYSQCSPSQAGAEAAGAEADGAGAAAAAAELDLLQIRDQDVLEEIVEQVIAAETRAVADYRSGKTAALNALLGRVMRATQGKGDPGRIRELLLRRLES